jgi:uncharacterized protein GlcG (DUF336 family)
MNAVTRIAPPLALAAALAAPAAAQDALAEFRTLTPDIALKAAVAARDACREAGYQVAVAVVDRFGGTQVVLRDRFAGPHTVPTATQKAWTAVSFREATTALDERIGSGDLTGALRDVPGALFLGGGVPVLAAGSLVAAIGISGAPAPALDEDCANAGIEAISADIAF